MSIYGNVESYRLGVAQSVTSVAGPTSTSSAAFGSTTYRVRIATTAAVNYRIGNGAITALAADTLLPPNWVETLYVTPGQVFASVGAATVSITELV